MPIKKLRLPRRPTDLCGRLNSDDCVDPREYLRRTSPASNRKTLQLCKQVERTLNYVISGHGHDEILSSLRVVAVEPAPNSGQLAVTVSSDLDPDEFDVINILRILTEELPRLRSEVAAAISRRRTPQLLFRVVSSRSD